MKLQLLTLTTLLALSTAESFPGEPACATACLVSAISKAGCAPTDVACQCGPTQSVIGGIVASCLIASCPASLLGVAETAGVALCSKYSAALSSATATKTAPPTTATTATVTPIVTSSSYSNKTSNSTVQTTTTASSSVLLTTSAPSVSSAATISSTTSAPATASSSAAMALLVSGIGGLAALFFGMVATL